MPVGLASQAVQENLYRLILTGDFASEHQFPFNVGPFTLSQNEANFIRGKIKDSTLQQNFSLDIKVDGFEARTLKACLLAKLSAYQDSTSSLDIPLRLLVVARRSCELNPQEQQSASNISYLLPSPPIPFDDPEPWFKKIGKGWMQTTGHNAQGGRNVHESWQIENGKQSEIKSG
ncbi:hypothetical protein MMC28_009517 [Mycoblastus sanguinarius]|nr:hypothetical protein [Mycoblastus sanguinarius]